MSDRIQLYTLGTPNGFKISIALEELGLPYDAHKVDISKGDQFTEEFVKINPNSKIPAIVDPNGPDGQPINVFESGSILLYLAEKTGKLLPSNPRDKVEAMNWLFWQMSGLGPMFGQFNHFFRFAKEKVPYGIKRYKDESIRLLTVLDKHLEGKEFVVGNELSVADLAIQPWIAALDLYPEICEELGISNFKNVISWKSRLAEREAFKKGSAVVG